MALPTTRFDAGTIAAILIALLSMLVSAFTGYSHNDKDIASRISVVETQQKGDHEGIQRVETKVDRLLDWAIGNHSGR
jgi:hypothetical protein